MERRKLTREQVEQIVREARERGEKPDLSGVDLDGVNLGRGLPLWGKLDGADLTRAYFGEADLSKANLSGANLSQVTHNSATLWPDGFILKGKVDARLPGLMELKQA
jgi:uncharacterized protein YjbI with pentapeptide repeats